MDKTELEYQGFRFNELKQHVGHKIVCVTYGDTEDPANVAIECESCHSVLVDYDSPKWSD